MIYSMTGYGKAEDVIGESQYTVEIKTLNGKFFDLQVKMPSDFREKELEIRKLLEKKLLRGKAVMFLNVESLSGVATRKLNTNVLQQYLNIISEAFPVQDQDKILSHLLSAPDVWEKQEPEDLDALWKGILRLLEKALDEVQHFRLQEGKELERDIIEKLEIIKKALNRVEELDPKRVEKIKSRLKKSLAELKGQVDPVRFEQEVIYYLDRLDINEEIVRLHHHINYFKKVLDSPEIVKGKKLQFIIQEMGREINTIGSKANDSSIQRKVVEMKDALEKIKEQTLNVL